MQIIGVVILSGVIAIIVGVAFMFIFFNLFYIVEKLKSVTSAHSSRPLNQSGANMGDRKQSQNRVDYYENVICPFLYACFRVKAGKHTTSIVKEREYNHKNCYANSNQESIDSAIPKVADNPSNDEVATHNDTLSRDND